MKQKQVVMVGLYSGVVYFIGDESAASRYLTDSHPSIEVHRRVQFDKTRRLTTVDREVVVEPIFSEPIKKMVVDEGVSYGIFE